MSKKRSAAPTFSSALPCVEIKGKELAGVDFIGLQAASSVGQSEGPDLTHLCPKTSKVLTELGPSPNLSLQGPHWKKMARANGPSLSPVPARRSPRK